MTTNLHNRNIGTDRWGIVKSVQHLKTQLGLNSRDCVVFSALMSFLRRNQTTKGGIVYPSNKTLSERAAGMSERSIRRALQALCEANLIARNDSPNRKRYPLKGEIKGPQDAFGIDLTPAFVRHTELLSLEHQASREEIEKKSLRAIILTKRHRLLAAPELLTNEVREFLEKLKTILRRKLNIQALRELYEKVLANPSNEAEQTQSEDLADTKEMTVRNGQTDRHQETPKKECIRQAEIKRTLPFSAVWANCSALSAFFPDMPKSEREITSLLIEIAKFMNIPKRMVLEALECVGLVQTMTILDNITGNISNVTSPSRYFAKTIANLEINCCSARKGFS